MSSARNSEAADGGDEPSPLGPKGASRRGFLHSAGGLAAAACLTATSTSLSGTAPAQAAMADEAFRIDKSCVVTKSRLNKLAAEAYSTFNEGEILPDFSTATLGAARGVDLHRIVTHTTAPETGERIKISGLLALPTGAKGRLPVVSWQHGTILSYDQVPSTLLRLKDPSYETTDAQDSFETLLNVHRLAGNGYAVIAADYVGKGPFRGDLREGYVVKDLTVSTCESMLSAGLAALEKLGHGRQQLFLHGWSQGGPNTQWLHQSLRSKGVDIAATAAASPFNDMNEALEYWTGAVEFPLPKGVSSYPEVPGWVAICIIIVLGSYERWYGLNGLVRSAVRPQYADAAERYLRTYDYTKLPSSLTVKTILRPGFLSDYTSVLNSAFLRQMAENRCSYWKYDRPIRFYYGTADQAIHPQMVHRAISAGGRHAAGISVADGSHRGTFLSSLYGPENVLGWFDGFRGRT
jgi:hypothetical protein